MGARSDVCLPSGPFVRPRQGKEEEQPFLQLPRPGFARQHVRETWCFHGVKGTVHMEKVCRLCGRPAAMQPCEAAQGPAILTAPWARFPLARRPAGGLPAARRLHPRLCFYCSVFV